MPKSSEFSLSDRELAEISAWAENREDRAVRLTIIQDAAAGLSVSESARRLGVSRPTVTAWRQRYAAGGLAGLAHRPRSGRPARIDEADVVAATLAGPPAPQHAWSARGLADHLGLSHTALGRVWQRWRIRPGAPETPAVLPFTPQLPCRQPELLAAWTQPDGSAFVLVAEAAHSPASRTKPVTSDERQMRYAALSAVLRRVHPADRTEPDTGPAAGTTESLHGADRRTFADRVPRRPAPVVPHPVTARWSGRQLHLVTWGEPADLAGLPVRTTRHAAPASMGWPATVNLLAQLELRHQPAAARVSLDALTDAAREHARREPGRPFWWLRPSPEASAVRRRTVHRAFDQLALGSFNEKLVIESIRVSGCLSRIEIAERTGLTPQAVSRITRNLLTTGILVADERRSTGTGKPRVPLRLRPDAACAIGIHVDPEMITLVLVDLCGNVRARHGLTVTPDSAPQPCLEWMARTALHCVDEAGRLGQNLLGAGVAAPGPLDMHKGVLLNLPLWSGWHEVPLRDELSRMLDLPVLLEKDATAATIGEQWLGAGESSTDFVYLYLGAGAGSGAFLNGDIYRGSSGNVGEFGELTAYALGQVTPEGGPRMVPECAPMSAVVARAAAAGLTAPAGELTYEAVCDAAAAGDSRASQAIKDVARVVARGAVAMTDLYDTDLMVVGGPAVPPAVAELYLTEISTAVNRYPIARQIRPVRVTYSTLSGSAAAVGAAAGVFHTAFAPRLRTHSGTGA